MDVRRQGQLTPHRLVRRRLCRAFAALAALLPLAFAAVPARAEDGLVDMARQLGISELRAGIMLDDVETSLMVVPHYDSIDLSKWQNLSLEVLFRSPDVDFVRWLGAPRLALGASLNFTGKESYATLSSVWHVPVFDTPVFFEPKLGVMVHNGYLSGAPPGRRNLGCPALFNIGFNLGVDVSDTVTAMLSVDHGSHLWLCGEYLNDGINRVGFRMGMKFS